MGNIASLPVFILRALCSLCRLPARALPTATWRKITLTQSQCDVPARGDEGAEERLSVHRCQLSQILLEILNYKTYECLVQKFFFPLLTYM